MNDQTQTAKLSRAEYNRQFFLIAYGEPNPDIDNWGTDVCWLTHVYALGLDARGALPDGTGPDIAIFATAYGVRWALWEEKVSPEIIAAVSLLQGVDAMDYLYSVYKLCDKWEEAAAVMTSLALVQ